MRRAAKTRPGRRIIWGVCASAHPRRWVLGAVVVLPAMLVLGSCGSSSPTKPTQQPPAVTPPGTERASLPITLNAFSGTTMPIENALLVMRWQSVQWHA